MHRILAALIALAFSTAAFADYRLKNDKILVDLFETPCVSEKVTQHIPDEIIKKFQAGQIIFAEDIPETGIKSGVPYALCWTDLGTILTPGGPVDALGVVFEDGTQQLAPKAIFEKIVRINL